MRRWARLALSGQSDHIHVCPRALVDAGEFLLTRGSYDRSPEGFERKLLDDIANNYREVVSS